MLKGGCLVHPGTPRGYRGAHPSLLRRRLTGVCLGVGTYIVREKHGAVEVRQADTVTVL